MPRLDESVFHSLTQEPQPHALEEIFCRDDEAGFEAYRTTALQSPLAAKTVRMARETARYILSDNGEIDSVRLVEAIEHLSHCLYPLGPYRHEETQIREHLLRMLKALKESSELKDRIKKLFVPSYVSIQNLIRDTLALEETASISTFHVRQAVLAAMFSYLRQDVGSCFATAPAILIHQEYPHRFLKDLEDLLSSGKLTRIIGSREVTIPINLSGCIGELFKRIRILDLHPDPIQTLSSPPGLQKAFEAAGVLHSLEAPQIQVQKLLAHEYLLKKLSQEHDTISAHEILQSTLLNLYQLSETTVKATLCKEGMFSKNPALFLSQDPRELSQNQRVYGYLFAYKQARRAFIHDTQNPLLKSWEYSLATLADANSSSTLNHIRISLGWNSNDSYSIATQMKQFIEQEIESLRSVVSKCEQTYQEARSQLDYIENRLKNPLNTQDSQILTMDHIRFRQELNKALYDWDAAQEKVKKLLNLPDYLLSFYAKAIPQYFRSAYDAYIQEFSHIHTDTPAGFRLLFTHGRAHPHAWSPVYSIEEFIRFLSEFFSLTEVDLMGKHAIVDLEKETSSLIHHLISLLHTEHFQEAALTRILNTYNLPVPSPLFDHLDTLVITPWVYISGGSVESLLTDYFELTTPITTIQKRPENAHELAAFFSDALKDLPEGIKSYLEEGDHSLLTASPTHVFSLTAGSPLFREAWDNDWYSYTWLRDVWVKQHKTFLENTLLSQPEVYACLGSFCSKYSLNSLTQELYDFCAEPSQSLPELYEKSSRFLQGVLQDAHSLELYQRRLARHLVQEPPYVSEQQLPETLEMISSYLGISSRMAFPKFQELIERHIPKLSLLSSSDLRHLYLGLLMQSYQKVYVEEDLYMRVASAMRHHKLAYPAPLLFGDSNWPYSYFGFLLHPGTGHIDLWQCNYAGLKASPLENLQEILAVTRPWTLYANPIDYGMPPPPGYRSQMPKGFF